MKISDLLIIYFSAAAPVAVYFYLQNQVLPHRRVILRETALTFLFWIPAAVRFFLKGDFSRANDFFKRRNETSLSSLREKNLYRLQKRFEAFLRASDCKCSVFEFRETLKRYVGLTLASQIQTSEANREFFLAAQNKNPALAAKCFERRNRHRLSFHQTSARRDYLKILALLSDGVSDSQEICSLAAEFAKVLEDFEAVKDLKRLLAAAQQSDKQSRSRNLEKDLWKPEAIRRPQTAFNSVSTLTRATTQTTCSSKKE